MVRSLFEVPCSVLVLTSALSPLAAATLELKSEKANAHNGWVLSVDFDKDGDKIVSGGEDGTIKVWDAGRPLGRVQLPFRRLSRPLRALGVALQPQSQGLVSGCVWLWQYWLRRHWS